MLSRVTLLGGCSAAAVLAASVLTGCSSTSPTKASPTTAAAPMGCSGDAGPTFTGAPTAYDAPVTTSDQREVATEVSAPTLSGAPSGSDQYRIASVHVSARVIQNGSYVVSPGSLSLQDQRGRTCPRPAKNPVPNPLSLTTIDEAHGANGNVAFLVPTDADLADYSVVYVAEPTDRTALAQWSRQGKAPQNTVTNACDGPRVAYDRKGARTSAFGSPTSTVDHGIGVTVTPQRPAARTLGPSSAVPADVDGVAVKVAVTATGAAAYVDRREFALLDSGGRTCRFGSVPSPGETLTSALVKAGSTGRYTLIFWVPKGAQLHSWTLQQLTGPTSKKVAAAWSTGAK